MNPNAYIEMETIESEHWWFIARRKILTDILLHASLPKNPKILEIGCGTGGNLHMLSKIGIVSAMDMNSYARTSAQNKHLNLTIKEGKCPNQIPFKPNSFDLICMFDVLEHIQEDEKTLFVIRSLLKKNGKIILAVPAHQWMFSNHDKYLHHKRRYSKKTLKKIIKSSELKIEKISYFNSILFPLSIVSRFLDKILHIKKSTGSTIPISFINSLFKKIFSSERFLLRYISLPFGLSLYCILNSTQNTNDNK